jgi:hypothetical protein
MMSIARDHPRLWLRLGRWGSTLAIALALALCLAQVARATGQPGAVGPGFDPVAALASAADEPARQQVARDILKRFASDASLRVAPDWLLEEPAQALRLLGATAESQADAEALAAALVRGLKNGGAEEVAWNFEAMSADARPASLSILSRSVEPASCQALIAWLESASNGQRRAIAQALIAMTGREDLGVAPQAWRQWFARHQHLPALAWRATLSEGVRQRAERLASRERDLVTRLTEASRRLYAALPPAERPALLAAMLADAEPSIRLAATDLLLRELERGIAPTPEVSTALTALLEDPQAPIRQAAAVLVDRIVPEGSAARLSVALRKETDPDVAAVMLRAYRRAPDAAAIDAVLRWLEHGEPTRTGAMRAVLSLLESGFTPTPEQAARILATIDPDQPATLPPSGVMVLARLGGQPGLDAARALLFDERAELRRAAADALAVVPGSVEDLLAAAEADPALLQRAADAVARHKPWATLLRRVATLELGTPTDASAAEPLPITAGLARFMPMPERLAAAQEMARRPLAVRAILGQPQREAFVDGPAGDHAYARARSLLGLPAPEPTATGEPAEARAAEPGDPLDEQPGG